MCAPAGSTAGAHSRPLDCRSCPSLLDVHIQYSVCVRCNYGMRTSLGMRLVEYKVSISNACISTRYVLGNICELSAKVAYHYVRSYIIARQHKAVFNPHGDLATDMSDLKATMTPRGKHSAPDMDILTDTVTIHPPLVPEQPLLSTSPAALSPTAFQTTLDITPSLQPAETIDITSEKFMQGSKNLSPAFVHVWSQIPLG